MTTPQEVLAGVPLFSMLPKKEVAKLARQAHEQTVAAGTVVTDVDRPASASASSTRCQICDRTLPYRPGNISEVLTEHYRQAHPEALGIPGE